MDEKTIKKIISDIKAGLRNVYGNRLKGVLLYGSYARKQQTAFSDLDLMIIIDDFSDIGKEIEKLSKLSSDISLKYDIIISLLPVREEDLRQRKTPLIRNVSGEGIAV